MVAKEIENQRKWLTATDSVDNPAYQPPVLIWPINAFLGQGKPLAISIPEIETAIKKASAVLLGMSSSLELAKEEIAAGRKAAELGIPFGFYADTYGVYKRPWFKDLREQTSFIFVINENEGRGAKEIFPHAKIIISGNPAWEDFCSPKYSYKEVRINLGIESNEKMVLSPGGKLAISNILLWGAVIEAAHSPILAPFSLKIFLATHPGDPNPPEIYSDLEKFSRIPVKIIPSQNIKISDLVPGCDILIESYTTTGIEAAHQRKPVIDFFTEIALNRLQSMTGTRNWELCDLGAAEPVYGCSLNLANSMARLLTRDGFAPMKQQQEEIYPHLFKGAVAQKMVFALQEFMQ
jgi:hypothetical protein